MNVFNLHHAALGALFAIAGTAAAAPLRDMQERQHGPAAGAAGVALRGEARASKEEPFACPAPEPAIKISTCAGGEKVTSTDDSAANDAPEVASPARSGTLANADAAQIAALVAEIADLEAVIAEQAAENGDLKTQIAAAE